MNVASRAVAFSLSVAALGACSSKGPAKAPAPYGAVQPQGTTTGAVSTVTPSKDAPQGGSVLDEVLQGRVAGLQVTTDDTGAQTVRIRNFGRADTPDYSVEPLLIIDGVKQPQGTGQIVAALRGITVDQVAKIQVLKDASQLAIYGTQGSSGVILITLKHD